MKTFVGVFCLSSQLLKVAQAEGGLQGQQALHDSPEEARKQQVHEVQKRLMKENLDWLKENETPPDEEEEDPLEEEPEEEDDEAGEIVDEEQPIKPVEEGRPQEVVCTSPPALEKELDKLASFSGAANLKKLLLLLQTDREGYQGMTRELAPQVVADLRKKFRIHSITEKDVEKVLLNEASLKGLVRSVEEIEQLEAVALAESQKHAESQKKVDFLTRVKKLPKQVIKKVITNMKRMLIQTSLSSLVQLGAVLCFPALGGFAATLIVARASIGILSSMFLMRIYDAQKDRYLTQQKKPILRIEVPLVKEVEESSPSIPVTESCPSIAKVSVDTESPDAEPFLVEPLESSYIA